MLTEPQSGKSYTYTSENLLKSSSGGGAPAAALTYDPLTNLYEDKQTVSGAAARFVYDGTDMIAEYDQSNALQKRYVFGADEDEPLVQLDAAGNRTWLTADERGSIIALSDDNANVIQIDKYDEYGKPQPTDLRRFQYTGQAWLGGLGTSPASEAAVSRIDRTNPCRDCRSLSRNSLGFRRGLQTGVSVKFSGSIRLPGSSARL